MATGPSAVTGSRPRVPGALVAAVGPVTVVRVGPSRATSLAMPEGGDWETVPGGHGDQGKELGCQRGEDGAQGWEGEEGTRVLTGDPKPQFPWTGQGGLGTGDVQSGSAGRDEAEGWGCIYSKGRAGLRPLLPSAA